jgi:nicotinate dehydrogenase subunit A
MAQSFRLNVNGEAQDVEAGGDAPLLYVLRNDLGLAGPKFGCGLGQCGACTVLIAGEAVRSCQVTLNAVRGRPIQTLEGLGTRDKPHPLQQAFIDEQAMQCGYCSNGMIMSAKALLDKNGKPSDADIKQALSGNLCRCGSHNRIVRAVARAAKEIAP